MTYSFAFCPLEKTYPLDERYWLLTSSYNTGIECLQYGFALHTSHVIHT